MNSHEIDLSVVMLNYKDANLTAKCVNHLITSTEKSEISTQIIVVDNSAEETAEELKHILPGNVEIIENIANFGFSKANNQGIVRSKGKYLLLLNNDAFVNPECIENGIKYFQENHDCGIWGPKLLGEDGSFQVSCARLPSIKGLMGEYILHKNYDWYSDVLDWKEPHNVGNIVGAFLLTNKSVIKKVGLLDEDFFFNTEDVDYCKRVHESGFNVVYDPRFTIVHIGGASQDYSWVDDPYLHKYRILYFKKNHGTIKSFLAFFIINLGLKIMKIRF